MINSPDSLLLGDCLEVLKTLPEDSIDALVTDPPAGISFMGKSWDGNKGGRKEWCAWMESVMRECLRVMKPGAHGLVWALPRTSHWTATALEDAGFEVRDCVYHAFGSGFPKSLDISKAIDKAAGVEREVIGRQSYSAPDIRGNSYDQSHVSERERLGVAITVPTTDAARQWQGWGTALKPAVECWWLIRKPLSEKTIAANVLKWGTGGLNIDGSRIATSDITGRPVYESKGWKNTSGMTGSVTDDWKKDRFPANLVLSHSPHCSDTQCDIECAVAMLDAQSGTLKSGKLLSHHKRLGSAPVGAFKIRDRTGEPCNFGGDSGGASRFFYCAKISSSERNAGLEGMPKKEVRRHGDTGPSDNAKPSGQKALVEANTHPTVKPQKLMRYLCRLVTPPKGVILDPFMGSGSTGLAAKSEGFRFIGIEREPEYFEIAKVRIGQNAI